MLLDLALVRTWLTLDADPALDRLTAAVIVLLTEERLEEG
jgi:hypothetical protein